MTKTEAFARVEKEPMADGDWLVHIEGFKSPIHYVFKNDAYNTAKKINVAHEAACKARVKEATGKDLFKFSCPCGETTYLLESHPNHFVDCICRANGTRMQEAVEKAVKEFAEKGAGIFDSRCMDAKTCLGRCGMCKFAAEIRKLAEGA